MKVICAWCKRVMREDGLTNELISHGICPVCSKKVKAEAESLRKWRAERGEFEGKLMSATQG
jgi:hypothetical protein